MEIEKKILNNKFYELTFADFKWVDFKVWVI
jgi:hypothetical protein